MSDVMEHFKTNMVPSILLLQKASSTAATAVENLTHADGCRLCQEDPQDSE